MKNRLEEFLVQNWEQTELGKKYDIYNDEENQLEDNLRHARVVLIFLQSAKIKKNFW